MSTLPDDIKKRQFLVTDDYESMRMMIIDHLNELGIEKIITANSGNEALKILKENLGKPTQIQFVMTDMMMEDGSGLDLARGIRADPALKGLPILMVTSKSEVNLVLEAVKAGVNNYVVKPWEIEDLAKKIVDTVNKVKA